MPSQIRPNRLEVNDRFPMLGFTIKTDGENKRYEVVLASDATLFQPDAKPKRTKANFYSSRAAGLQPIAKGEAVYVLPPEVLARFVGQEKLYYALATYSNGKAGPTETTSLSPAGSAYINLTGLSGRSLKRVQLLPSRQRVASSYGNGAGSELEWGGDAMTPGTRPVSSSVASPAKANGKSAAETVPGNGPIEPQGAGLDYDDGFGPLQASGEASPAIARPLRTQPTVRPLSNDLLYDVHLIPQPDKTACWAASMAMLVGFRRQISISPEALAQAAGRSLRTSYDWDMIDAVKDHFGFQTISLPSNASLYYTPEQWRQWLNDYGPLWVTTVGDPSHAIIVTGLSGDLTASGITVSILNPWDTTQTFSSDPVDFDPPNQGRVYTQSFSDFTADFGTLGLDNYGEWRVLYLPATIATSQGMAASGFAHNTTCRPANVTAAGTSQPPRFAKPVRASARAQSNESFTINWDDVQLVAQPTDVSCWAASAAMVIGWRDQLSLDPATVAEIGGRTTTTGLDPTQVQQFAGDLRLSYESPQSYTIESFRQLLEQFGPLWVGAAVPGLHAIVVTGLYSGGAEDGSDTYLRVTDPWDRVTGSPGAPGAYLDTHNTGSRYILSWADFVREYEGAARFDHVNLQILHVTDNSGRQPNRGGAAGYAMASGSPVGSVAPTNKQRASQFGVPSAERSRIAVHAQADQSFTVNWEDVELVPQPTGNSCWATAATMIIGWRDQVSLTPERVADIAGRSICRGLNPNERRQFAGEIGLEYEEPQSYTVDAFRTLLENYGPLWVSVQLPNSGHAIVVTGMYSDGAPDGSGTYIRVSDPWDRVVGAPGGLGGYLNTHNTGSRYILSWVDFTREYEQRASCAGDGTVNVQILHSAGNSGRQPNSSGARGYAMAAGTVARNGAASPSAVKLPNPPVPVVRARTMDAGVAEVVSVVAGAVMEKVISHDGNITWELDQLRGLKHPNDVVPNPAPPFRDATTVRLDTWPYVEAVDGDQISAWFSLDWQFNGKSLGNVSIANIGTNGALLRGLHVEAKVMDDNIVYPRENPTFAALRVRFTYRFTRSLLSDAIAITELHLYGDGTWDETGRWEQY